MYFFLIGMWFIQCYCQWYRNTNEEYQWTDTIPKVGAVMQRQRSESYHRENPQQTSDYDGQEPKKHKVKRLYHFSVN